MCDISEAQFREPLIQTTVPDRPWQKVGYLSGQERHIFIAFMLIVDYFSRYTEIARVRVT